MRQFIALTVLTASAATAADFPQKLPSPGGEVTLPDADAKALKLCARLALAVIFLLALTLATFAPAVQAQLGSLALGFGLQLWPALAGLCWIKWVTRQGATLGVFPVLWRQSLAAGTRYRNEDFSFSRSGAC